MGKSNRIYFISFKEKYLKTIKEWIAESLPNLRKAKILPVKSKIKENQYLENFDGVSIKSIKEEQINFFREKKKIISVWTKTSKKKIKKYMKRKVDFITTNNPKKCLKIARKFREEI